MNDRCATAINRYLRYGRLPVPLLDSNRVFSLVLSGQKPGTVRVKRGKNSLRGDRETSDAVSKERPLTIFGFNLSGVMKAYLMGLPSLKGKNQPVRDAPASPALDGRQTRDPDYEKEL